MTLRIAGHRPQLIPLPLQRLARRRHVQIAMPTPFQVAVVSERVSQKVQVRLLLAQVHHARLLTVDLQPHPGFQLLLDIPAQVRGHIARQHDKIVGVTHQFRLRPAGRPLRAVEHLVEPVQVQIRQQRRNHGLNAKDNVGWVGVSAAAAVREAGGMFRSDRARHSVSGWNGGW